MVALLKGFTAAVRRVQSPTSRTAEIGIRLGVSQMQVSRIIRGAIEQLSVVATQQQQQQQQLADRNPTSSWPLLGWLSLGAR